jgi:hypothetical protein
MPVKPEDFDSEVYHILSAGKGSTPEALAEETGCPREAVNESLRRLLSYLLIDYSGGKYQALSVPEMLLRCQCRFAADLPFIIEDGVIKPKKPEQ